METLLSPREAYEEQLQRGFNIFSPQTRAPSAPAREGLGLTSINAVYAEEQSKKAKKVRRKPKPSKPNGNGVLHDACSPEELEDMFGSKDTLTLLEAAGVWDEEDALSADRGAGERQHVTPVAASEAVGPPRPTNESIGFTALLKPAKVRGQGRAPPNPLWSAVRKLQEKGADPKNFDGGTQHGGIWPSPFPGYKGLFTYEVKGDERESDNSLGNGVYLWMLEIIPGTVRIGVPITDEDAHVLFACHMKKTLIQTPDDACLVMQACVNCFIVENWLGRAEVNHKAFHLDEVDFDEPPVESTIDFSGLPLDRQALAGKYEMELAADDSVVKAVHVSWMEFANISADDASGFMFRLNRGSKVCPVLRPPLDDELDHKLHEAAELMHGSRVYQKGDAHIVRYWPTTFKVSDISSTDGTFEVELELAMDYLVSRDDVFEYIIRPQCWKPRWHPRVFEPMNARDIDAVRTQVSSPTLKVLGEAGQRRELRAEILITYRGVFEELFELQSFPFDVQPLHVKLHVEQDGDTEMVLLDKADEAMQIHGKVSQRSVSKFVSEDTSIRERLKKKWKSSEWKFLDARVAAAHQKKGFGRHSGCAARLFVSLRVQRQARSYLIRIVGVVTLICFLTLCIFVIDAEGDLADMLGHSFMMMLTLTTYSLVVGDILPNLGYLTVLDQLTLISFVFLALVITQIAWLGWAVRNAVEDVADYNLRFAQVDMVTLFVSLISYAIYVKIVIQTREFQKAHVDPSEELDDQVSQTQKVGRFSVIGVSDGR
jgi:hypothetical protein